eukprot:TRINITY_DN10695_c0_g1_i1.p1 TRINITY_DN10695_c0_g1~~TRINITY_DN10695_c0_g1_i1.p1  ORF type:complete len:146 (+),score=94.30 TRINITY_DN10695_c0_g1_i1:110-547(+)
MAQPQPQPVNPLPPHRQEHYQQRMNKESQELKEMQKKMAKLQGRNQQLQLQKQENAMVEHEFNIMEEDAQVYKLIGPALVSQDPSDGKAIVSKRLEYITGEIKGLEAEIATTNKAYDKQKLAVNKVQEDFKAEVEQLLKKSQQQQ